MKLSLTSQEGIQILETQGPADIHAIEVLKAGVTKILRAGRNKIVLQLGQTTETISDEVIREIAILDVFAKELSGTIVVVCANEQLKQSIINFSKPPVMAILPTLEAALSFFRVTKVDAEELVDPDALKEALEAKEKELAALQSRIALLDPAALQQARHEKAELETKNKWLEEQLAEIMKARRSPPGLEAYEQKVLLLEESLKKLTEQMQKEKK